MKQVLSASEIALRERIKAKSAIELVARRDELEQQLAAASEPSPAQKRLGRLEGRIAEGKSVLADLAGERAELERQPRPNKERLSRIETNERFTARQVSRLESERPGLTGEAVDAATHNTGLSGSERAELAVIEDRLTALRRRQIALERARPTQIIEQSLGARPRDPLKAALWSEGVETIYVFRQRYGITSTGGHPLGPKSRDAVRDAERRQAELRLARVQLRLGKQQVRRAERAMRIAR